MRTYTNILAAVAALVLLALVAGCGGGGGSETTTSNASTSGNVETGGSAEGGKQASSADKQGAGGENHSAKGGSKAKFVASANAICTQADARFQAGVEPYLASGEGFTGVVKEADSIVNEVLVPNLETEISNLRTLNPPAKDAAGVEQLFAALQEVAEQARVNPKEFALEGGSYAKSEQLAARYGIPACGSL